MTNHQLADFLAKNIDNLVIKTDRLSFGLDKLAEATAAGFIEAEEKRSGMEARLINKIEAVHGNAHHRMDRIEDKIHRLV